MAVGKGSAKGTVYVVGNTRGFSVAMRKATWEAATFQQRMMMLGGQMKKMGRSMTRHVTLPIVALGAASVVAAVKVDKAYAKIRSGTGATGAKLEKLKASFENVAKESTQSLDEVATAIADVNTRLGLTGKPLERVTRQFLDLARVTGSDVADGIRLGTRLFGDWSIAAKDQAGALDLVYRATQQSGIGLSDLMQTVVQFGAPLRNMGFEFEESVAMLAKWEKEGVNTSTVLTGMKFALKTFAKAGKDPQKALEQLIPTMRDMKDEQAAMSLGMETFGLRAGPDMVAAIREGRFEYADFAKEIAGGKDTIAAAAKDTETLSERMAKLKNRAMLVGADIGEQLIPIIEKLADYVGRAVTWFSNLDSKWQKTIMVGLAVVAALGPLLSIIGGLITAMPILIGVFVALTSPIGLIIAGVALLVTGLILLYRKNETFRNIVDSVWGAIKTAVMAVVGAVKAVIGKMQDLWGWVKDHESVFAAALNLYFWPIKTAIGWVQDLIGWLKQAYDWISKLGAGGGIKSSGGKGGVGRSGPATGGITTGPISGYSATLHGTEAVIPLNGNTFDPQLYNYGGGSGQTIVQVFIGNEQIEPKVTKMQRVRSQRLARGFA